jgi:hypothetical protein
MTGILDVVQGIGMDFSVVNYWNSSLSVKTVFWNLTSYCLVGK